MLRMLAVLCLGLALAACQSEVEAPLRNDVAFDPAAAAFINKKGKVTLEGHAFLRKKSGGTIDASGEIVRLIPVTAYALERFQRLYRGKKFAGGIFAPHQDAADPQYAALLRQTIAESDGTFSFANVAAGHYYVATQLQYQGSSKYFQEGGAFYEEVTITGKEEEAVKLVLSGN